MRPDLERLLGGAAFSRAGGFLEERLRIFKRSWTAIHNHYHIFGFDSPVVPWQGAGGENG